MTQGRRRIDRILSEAYLDALADKPTDEIRTMRAECASEEASVSYERRMLQGRLDLLRAEVKRRATGDPGSLVDLLPQILADDGPPASRGSFPTTEPAFELENPHRRVTKLISNDTLVSLSERTDDEIQSLIAELEQAERDVSATRHKLHEVVDRLNAELAQRYKSGDAQPSDLLTDH